MRTRILILAVVIIMAGCATPGLPPGTPQTAAGQIALGNALAVEETAVVRETIAALDAQAVATRNVVDTQATIQAQAVQATNEAAAAQARATAQAQAAQSTQAAIYAESTRRAHFPTATAAAARSTAAAENRNATATATRENATATSQAIADNAYATAVQATSQHIARRNQTERITQPLKMLGALGFMLAAASLLLWCVIQLLPSISARIGAIKRDIRGDLPMVVMSAGGIGTAMLLDPSRSWGPATLIDGKVSQPTLAPSAGIQDAQSKRSDFIDLVKGGRPRPIIASPAGGNGAIQQPQPEPWREVEERPVQWPHQVNLLDVFADKTPSLNHLVVGVYPQPDGRQAVIGASLHELMHTLAVGASGWGKSTWLRSFLWQLAQASEPVEVVAIDISGSEFNLLTKWNKLRYPVARTHGDAVAVLDEVSSELARRKEAFERYPLASKLTEYNRLSGDDLPPVVVIADEGAALLNRNGTDVHLREAIQTARQYGIYCVLASVSATFRTIPTETRDQFSTRLAFKTSPSSSRVVLDDKRAGDLAIKGRMWAQLTGREIIQVQGAWVSRMDFLRAIEGSGPMADMPRIEESVETDDREQRVRDLLETEPSLSDTAVARTVYGHGTTHYIEKVRAIKSQWEQQQQQSNNNNTAGEHNASVVAQKVLS